MSRLIDADALIPMMRYATIDNEIGVFPIKIGFDAIKKVIDEQPTIEPERKTAIWEPIKLDWGGLDFRCSACHRCRFHNGEMRKKYKFCPNCGADTRGDQP